MLRRHGSDKIILTREIGHASAGATVKPFDYLPNSMQKHYLNLSEVRCVAAGQLVD